MCEGAKLATIEITESLLKDWSSKAKQSYDSLEILILNQSMVDPSRIIGKENTNLFNNMLRCAELAKVEVETLFVQIEQILKNPSRWK